jgi:hypothetical protein
LNEHRCSRRRLLTFINKWSNVRQIHLHPGVNHTRK